MKMKIKAGMPEHRWG